MLLTATVIQFSLEKSYVGNAPYGVCTFWGTPAIYPKFQASDVGALSPPATCLFSGGVR